MIAPRALRGKQLQTIPDDDALHNARVTSLRRIFGRDEHAGRKFEAKHRGGFCVDHDLESGWSLHRQIGRLFASQDAIDIAGCATVLIGGFRTVGDEPANPGEIRIWIDRGQSMLLRELQDLSLIHI